MSKSYVTLEQAICPVCGKTEDTGALLLDRRLKERFEMYTPTGYKLCTDCQSKKDQGYIALIEAVQELGEKNPRRTGQVIHVREAVFTDIFNCPVPEQGIAFIEPEVGNHLTKLHEQIHA